jgi:hypothetical protein
MRPPSKKLIRAFINPSVPINYFGEYTIQLDTGTDLHRIPKGAQIDGLSVHIECGQVQLKGHGFDFSLANLHFSYACLHVLYIFDKDSNLLWVNEHSGEINDLSK